MVGNMVGNMVGTIQVALSFFPQVSVEDDDRMIFSDHNNNAYCRNSSGRPCRVNPDIPDLSCSPGH